MSYNSRLATNIAEVMLSVSQIRHCSVRSTRHMFKLYTYISGVCIKVLDGSETWGMDHKTECIKTDMFTLVYCLYFLKGFHSAEYHPTQQQIDSVVL